MTHDHAARIKDALRTLAMNAEALANEVDANGRPWNPSEAALIRCAAIPAIQESYEIALAQYMSGNGPDGFSRIGDAAL